MTDITELAQLRAELLSPAIGSNAHLRKIALSLVEALEKAQTKAIEQGRTACELFDEVTALRQRIAELESRTVTVKLPEGDERDDLVISITEEIAHLQRCVERYRKEEMASTTQEMEQRLLVQQIALLVLNSTSGIKWEAE